MACVSVRSRSLQRVLRSVGGGRGGRGVAGGVRRADAELCCIVHAAARRCHGWYAAAALGWVVVCMACACDDACALDGGGSIARAAHEEWWWCAGRVAMRRGVHGAPDNGMPLLRRCCLLSSCCCHADGTIFNCVVGPRCSRVRSRARGSRSRVDWRPSASDAAPLVVCGRGSVLLCKLHCMPPLCCCYACCAV